LELIPVCSGRNRLWNIWARSTSGMSLLSVPTPRKTAPQYFSTFTKKILTKHTLLASIKMPIDLFIGKSSVQTNVYVFKVNEKHHKDEVVKFIDFSNDGYTRTNRKKASNNLKDTDQAKERYEEVVNLVRFGKSKLNVFTDKEYFEGTIDPQSGSDWNQSAPVDTKPTLQDFKKTVSDYLAWEVSNIIKQQNKEDKSLGK